MKQIEYTKKRALELGWEKGKPKLYATIWDKRGRILAESSNSYKKTHPVQARMAKKKGREEQTFLHAELDAIVSLLRKGKEGDAFLICVVRLNKEGEEMNAKPCPICQAMMLPKDKKWGLRMFCLVVSSISFSLWLSRSSECSSELSCMYYSLIYYILRYSQRLA